MDPVAISLISTSIVQLLGKFFEKFSERLGSRAADASVQQVSFIYETVKNRFVQDPDRHEILNQYQHNPDDSDSREKFEKELVQALKQDHQFAAVLKEHMKKAAESNVDRVFNTNITGDVAKLVQIMNVEGDVNL